MKKGEALSTPALSGLPAAPSGPTATNVEEWCITVNEQTELVLAHATLESKRAAQPNLTKISAFYRAKYDDFINGALPSFLASSVWIKQLDDQNSPSGSRKVSASNPESTDKKVIWPQPSPLVARVAAALKEANQEVKAFRPRHAKE